MTNKKTFQASENISVEPVRPSQEAMYEIRLTKKGWRRVLKPEHCGTWGRPGTRNCEYARSSGQGSDGSGFVVESALYGLMPGFDEFEDPAYLW
jgi:hypothetical protein